MSDLSKPRKLTEIPQENLLAIGPLPTFLGFARPNTFMVYVCDSDDGIPYFPGEHGPALDSGYDGPKVRIIQS